MTKLDRMTCWFTHLIHWEKNSFDPTEFNNGSGFLEYRHLLIQFCYYFYFFLRSITRLNSAVRTTMAAAHYEFSMWYYRQSLKCNCPGTVDDLLPTTLMESFLKCVVTYSTTEITTPTKYRTRFASFFKKMTRVFIKATTHVGNRLKTDIELPFFYEIVSFICHRNLGKKSYFIFPLHQVASGIQAVMITVRFHPSSRWIPAKKISSFCCCFWTLDFVGVLLKQVHRDNQVAITSFDG